LVRLGQGVTRLKIENLGDIFAGEDVMTAFDAFREAKA
jgi:hypothetical protein